MYIEDEYWRIVVEEGDKWDFCYVHPNHQEEPIETVVPTALQMGWTDSPYLSVQQQKRPRMWLHKTLYDHWEH